MNWNRAIRQTHRWLSVLFTLAFLVVSGAVLRGEPAEWVYLLPLPPLFLLFGTGLYLFALPFVARWRGGGGAAETGWDPGSDPGTS